MKKSVFIPITKVDVERREVWGTLSHEVPDREGEIFDYESSKPHFEKWATEVSDLTQGKSKGALRAMHQAVAAGKLIDMQFDDQGRRIAIGAKVVDDAEWEKCLEGVYTGFSAGGDYIRRWKDPVNGDLVRYEAAPYEASLVDWPCVPTATFDLVKGAGLTETRHFKKVAERDDANAAEGEDKYGDVEFADAKNKKYPIDTEAHVRSALSYWGQEKNRAKYSDKDQRTIGARIRSAAARFNIALENADKVVLAQSMVKGLWDVGRLAGVVQDLGYMQQNVVAERAIEGDSSTLPEKLLLHVEGLLECLKEMAIEESTELLDQLHAAGAAKAAGASITKSTTTGSTAMTKAAEAFRKFSKANSDALAALTKEARAMHEEMNGHVESLSGTDQYESAKALHAKMGAYCDKLEGFTNDVGGLPTTEAVGSEEHAVTGAEKAQLAGDLAKASKRATDAETQLAKATTERAAFEKRAVDAESALATIAAERDKAIAERDETLDLADKLLEKRKGSLVLVDDATGKPIKKAKEDAVDDDAKLSTREKVRKAIRSTLQRPQLAGFGGGITGEE